RIAKLDERATVLHKKVNDLESNVAGITSSVEEIYGTTEKLTASADKASKRVKAMEDSIAELNALIHKLELKQDALIGGLDRELVSVNRALSDISDYDEAGNRILAVRNTMQSKKGREQLSDVVHESLKRKGMLRIHNKMPYDQRIQVNGGDYDVRAGQTLVINDVPLGTLTTELVGWEAPRNWTIAPPTYEQTIMIEPARAPRVAPPRVVYVDPPNFIDDWAR
ncbi:MAG TPA: hypothetical protein VND64_21170, partial [Pirellulales bacterium]|nr:hypothetical protein [Pirellulales bacterium]